MIKYMIGDLLLYDGQPFTIENGEEIDKLMSDEGNPTPIPLTQEILYKNTYDEASNTYHVYNTVGYVQYCITDRFVIKCYTDGEKEVFKYEGLVLEYVHDLQHLLEIARIDKKIVL